MKNGFAISEPLPKIAGWHKQCLIWESGSPYLYLRTSTEGRVIVGGEDEDFVNAKRRDALISQKTRTLVKKFGRLYPDASLEVAYAWAGTFGETKDGLAYIGVHPWYPHACFALGYGGKRHHFQPHRCRDHPGLRPRPETSQGSPVSFQSLMGEHAKTDPVGKS